MLTAVFLTYRSPANAMSMTQTPYEQQESRKPYISNVSDFECKLFVHVSDELWRKVDSKAWVQSADSSEKA